MIQRNSQFVKPAKYWYMFMYILIYMYVTASGLVIPFQLCKSAKSNSNVASILTRGTNDWVYYGDEAWVLCDLGYDNRIASVQVEWGLLPESFKLYGGLHEDGLDELIDSTAPAIQEKFKYNTGVDERDHHYESIDIPVGLYRFIRFDINTKSDGKDPGGVSIFFVAATLDQPGIVQFISGLSTTQIVDEFCLSTWPPAISNETIEASGAFDERLNLMLSLKRCTESIAQFSSANLFFLEETDKGTYHIRALSHDGLCIGAMSVDSVHKGSPHYVLGGSHYAILSNCDDKFATWTIDKNMLRNSRLIDGKYKCITFEGNPIGNDVMISADIEADSNPDHPAEFMRAAFKNDYWQSTDQIIDRKRPVVIEINFPNKVSISKIQIYWRHVPTQFAVHVNDNVVFRTSLNDAAISNIPISPPIWTDSIMVSLQSMDNKFCYNRNGIILCTAAIYNLVVTEASSIAYLAECDKLRGNKDSDLRAYLFPTPVHEVDLVSSRQFKSDISKLRLKMSLLESYLTRIDDINTNMGTCYTDQTKATGTLSQSLQLTNARSTHMGDLEVQKHIHDCLEGESEGYIDLELRDSEHMVYCVEAVVSDFDMGKDEGGKPAGDKEGEASDEEEGAVEGDGGAGYGDKSSSRKSDTEGGVPETSNLLRLESDESSGESGESQREGNRTDDGIDVSNGGSGESDGYSSGVSEDGALPRQGTTPDVTVPRNASDKPTAQGEGIFRSEGYHQRMEVGSRSLNLALSLVPIPMPTSGSTFLEVSEEDYAPAPYHAATTDPDLPSQPHDISTVCTDIDMESMESYVSRISVNKFADTYIHSVVDAAEKLSSGRGMDTDIQAVKLGRMLNGKWITDSERIFNINEAKMTDIVDGSVMYIYISKSGYKFSISPPDNEFALCVFSSVPRLRLSCHDSLSSFASRLGDETSTTILCPLNCRYATDTKLTGGESGIIPYVGPLCASSKVLDEYGRAQIEIINEPNVVKGVDDSEDYSNHGISEKAVIVHEYKDRLQHVLEKSMSDELDIARQQVALRANIVDLTKDYCKDIYLGEPESSPSGVAYISALNDTSRMMADRYVETMGLASNPVRWLTDIQNRISPIIATVKEVIVVRRENEATVRTLRKKVENVLKPLRRVMERLMHELNQLIAEVNDDIQNKYILKRSDRGAHHGSLSVSNEYEDIGDEYTCYGPTSSDSVPCDSCGIHMKPAMVGNPIEKGHKGTHDHSSMVIFDAPANVIDKSNLLPMPVISDSAAAIVTTINQCCRIQVKYLQLRPFPMKLHIYVSVSPPDIPSVWAIFLGRMGTAPYGHVIEFNNEIEQVRVLRPVSGHMQLVTTEPYPYERLSLNPVLLSFYIEKSSSGVVDIHLRRRDLVDESNTELMLLKFQDSGFGSRGHIGIISDVNLNLMYYSYMPSTSSIPQDFAPYPPTCSLVESGTGLVPITSVTKSEVGLPLSNPYVYSDTFRNLLGGRQDLWSSATIDGYGLALRYLGSQSRGHKSSLEGHADSIIEPSIVVFKQHRRCFDGVIRADILMNCHKRVVHKDNSLWNVPSTGIVFGVSADVNERVLQTYKEKFHVNDPTYTALYIAGYNVNNQIFIGRLERSVQGWKMSVLNRTDSPYVPKDHESLPFTVNVSSQSSTKGHVLLSVEVYVGTDSSQISVVPSPLVATMPDDFAIGGQYGFYVNQCLRNPDQQEFGYSAAFLNITSYSNDIDTMDLSGSDDVKSMV